MPWTSGKCVGFSLAVFVLFALDTHEITATATNRTVAFVRSWIANVFVVERIGRIAHDFGDCRSGFHPPNRAGLHAGHEAPPDRNETPNPQTPSVAQMKLPVSVDIRHPSFPSGPIAR